MLSTTVMSVSYTVSVHQTAFSLMYKLVHLHPTHDADSDRTWLKDESAQDTLQSVSHVPLPHIFEFFSIFLMFQICGSLGRGSLARKIENMSNISFFLKNFIFYNFNNFLLAKKLQYFFKTVGPSGPGFPKKTKQIRNSRTRHPHTHTHTPTQPIPRTPDPTESAAFLPLLLVGLFLLRGLLLLVVLCVPFSFSVVLPSLPSSFWCGRIPSLFWVLLCYSF